MTDSQNILNQNNSDSAKKSQTCIDSMNPSEESKETSVVQKTSDEVFPVWVGDIPLDTTDSSIAGFFTKFGDVSSVRCTNARGKQKNRKYAFVNFSSSNAQKAACAHDGIEWRGNNLQIKFRQTAERWHQIFVGNLNLNNQVELKNELNKLGNWKIQGIRMRQGQGKNKYAFVFFNTNREASEFYDDLSGKSIKGQNIFVEFPRTPEERAALKAGIAQKQLDKAKKTVYISSLNVDVTEAHIEDFCKQYGEITKVKVPKDKNTHESRGMAFVEFVRKTSADKFVDLMLQNEMKINESSFKVEKSKINLTRHLSRKFSNGYNHAWLGRGHMSGRGYGGRGNYGFAPWFWSW